MTSMHHVTRDHIEKFQRELAVQNNNANHHLSTAKATEANENSMDSVVQRKNTVNMTSRELQDKVGSVDTFNNSRASDEFNQPVKIAATVLPKKQLALSHLAGAQENRSASPYDHANDGQMATGQSSNQITKSRLNV